MAAFSYAGALAFLDSRGEALWDLGLGRIRGLLSRLGDPQDSAPCIHVAGTNGKGSFCALLASVLRAAGLRTGLYTSPHLLDPRERIAVDGEPVAPAAFAASVAAAKAAEREPATYFELLTAAAFHRFREARVDAAVVETGLGGRLDATNALRSPLLTVVTSIGLDHTAHLGATLAAIAGEKAGILKRGVPCLCGERAREPLSVIRRRAAQVGSPLKRPRATLKPVGTDWMKGIQRVAAPGGKEFALALLGAAARRNAALALDAVGLLRERGLKIPDEAAARGLAAARWPGRFQVVAMPPLPGRRASRTLVLDGAHNVPAMKAFLETWAASPFSRGKRPRSGAGGPLAAAPFARDALFLIGLLADKDVDGLLGLLSAHVRRAVAARPQSPRALPARELARRLRALGVEVLGEAEDAREALALWDASGASCAALCGSFYLVGGALRALAARPPASQKAQGAAA